MTRWTPCLAPFFLLVACGGAPSEEEDRVSLPNATVETTKKLKDEMCACKDKACASPDGGTRNALNEEFTKCMTMSVAR